MSMVSNRSGATTSSHTTFETRPRLRVPPGQALRDGVLEAQTAAILEPYIGRNGRRDARHIMAHQGSDLVVLERDLFAIPPSEIYRVKVLLTLLDGKEIYRDPAFKMIEVIFDEE
jgi:hypothetical protein